MTQIERRITFLSGILTNVWNSLNHAEKLVDGESFQLLNYEDDEGRRLIYDAFDAVEKAKAHFDRKMELATTWAEEKPTLTPNDSAPR